jgi:hypothetical protein
MITGGVCMEATRQSKSTALFKVCVFSVIFLGLFLFFCKVHPIYIYDADDWEFVSCARRVIPRMSYWNPSRIFPESMMPLVCETGVRVLRLFKVEYIDSLMYSIGIALCVMIIIYLYFFDQMIDKVLEIRTHGLLMVFFLLCHFWPYNVSKVGNYHMFYAGTAACTFFYTIPSLMSAAVVFRIITNRFPTSFTKLKNDGAGAWIWTLVLYWTIFSNMYVNIICIAFIGIMCLWNWCESGMYKKLNLRNWNCWKQYLQDNSIYYAVIVVWLLSLLFEAHGGRARNISDNVAPVSIVSSVQVLFRALISLNKFFILGYILMIGMAVITMAIRIGRKSWNAMDKKFLLLMIKLYSAMFVVMLYLVLLATKTGAGYLANNKALYGVMLYIVLQMTVSFGYVVKQWDIYKMVIPVAIYILLFETVFHSMSFQENYRSASDQSTEVVKALDRNIVNQMIQADQAGLSETTVYLPYHGSQGWPMPAVPYLEERIARTMYSHGITTRRIEVHLEVDEAIDEQFGMKY